MFDLDSTLIRTQSGHKHPLSATDWQWWSTRVIPKLRKLAEDNWAIIIITNQAGVSSTLFRGMILEQLQFVFGELIDECEPDYAALYVATAYDIYRKPNTTIFEQYIWPLCGKLQRVYYVGDAAGREHNSSGKPDFSDSDRKFAFNLNLFLRHVSRESRVKFYTPDEFFDHTREGSPRIWSGFDPQKYYKEAERVDSQFARSLHARNSNLLIIFVGVPASGKTTLANKIMDHHAEYHIIYINQDTCGTNKKCLTDFHNELRKWDRDDIREGIAIIDNTNPSKSARAAYIREVRAATIPFIIKCIVMGTSRELCAHLNIYRERLAIHRGDSHGIIPEAAYKKFENEFEEPSRNEGIDDIICAEFIPEFRTQYELVMFMQKT